MDSTLPPFRLPTSRLIVNVIATPFFLLILAAILFGVGDSLSKWERTSAYSKGTRTIRIGWDGVEFEFNPPRPVMRQSPNANEDSPEGFNFLGIAYTHDVLEWRNAGVRWRNTTLGFPWWPLVIIFAARPLFRGLCKWDESRILAAAKKRRGRVNLANCAVCGYDLRATPNRCPECGTIPPPRLGRASLD